MAYEVVAEYVRGLGGDLEWRGGGEGGGGYWRLAYQGKVVWFPFWGWCPLDTMLVQKTDDPQDADDYHNRLRDDAFWKLVEIFYRSDVLRESPFKSGW